MQGGAPREGARRPVLGLVCLALTAGCVERRLVLEVDPPEAIVYVNGDRLGTSPVEWPFVHYGTVRIHAEAPTDADRAVRHHDFSGAFPLTPPWYQRFPFSFLAEVLDPRTHEDVHHLRVSLSPVVPPSAATDTEEDALRRRAESMREGTGR